MIQINTLDIETKLINNYFIPDLVCLILNEKNYSFLGQTSLEDMFIFMNERIIDNVTFYVHNINFDGTLIIDHMVRNNIQFKTFVVKNNIYYIRIELKHGTIEIRCSYKLLPRPLTEIGEKLFGIPKMPYPYRVLENKTIPNKVEEGDFKSKDEYDRYVFITGSNSFNYYKYTEEYCMNDVKITKLFVEEYWKTLSGMKIEGAANKYSASSISVYTFFKYFNTMKIKKLLPIDQDIYVRRGYFGGRCEVFGNAREGEFIHHFDYSGMYGQCMLEDFPIGEGKLTHDGKWTDIGIHTIRWRWKGNIPILPMRGPGGKLMFYQGEGVGTYWYEEIEYFVNSGGVVIETMSSLLFNKVGKAFEGYVTKMGDIRKMGGLYKEMGKLLVNSFYGRLGMSGGETNTEIFNISELDIREARIKSYIRINDTIVAEVRKKEGARPTISNPLMAMIITSKARIKLHKGFQSVLGEGGRLLYCDTDSIVAAFDKDMTGRTLGEVYYDKDDNMSRLLKATFSRPKTYSLVLMGGKEVTKIRGFSRDTIGYDEFERKFYAGEGVVEKEHTQIRRGGFKLFRGVAPKATDLWGYDKREFIEDMKETIPINLLE